MRLNNTKINNVAIYTGLKTDALRRFVNKYNKDVIKLERDVTKYKKIRLDIATAVSGYQDNEIAQEIKAKYGLNESRRAFEFFDSKHGKAIINLLKRNGKVFKRDLVKQYLEHLSDNDLKYAIMMDNIASNIGLNHAAYKTYGEQEKAILDAIESLYNEHSGTDDNVVLTKKTINEMVEKAAILNYFRSL